MKKTTEHTWVIRAGTIATARVAAHALFVDHSFIALADQQMGDLRLIANTRPAFYKKFLSFHKSIGRSAIANIGGKFFRFAHEIRKADLILYPCRVGGRVYFGKVVGNYFYTDSKDTEFPHRRKVRWLGHFPKSKLSEFARREIGAARTLFRISTNVDEIRKIAAEHHTRTSAKLDVPNRRANRP